MSSLRLRLAAGAATIVVAAFASVSIVSPAAAAAPGLSLHYGNDAVDIDSTGTTIHVWAYNNGDAGAAGVTATFDLSGLRDVKVSIDEYAENCTQSGKTVTCTVNDLQPETEEFLYPFTLASTPRAATGPAGSVKGTIKGTAADGTVHTGTAELAINIVATGADLVAVAENLNTPEKPAGPGDILPIKGGFFNEGDSTAEGFFVRLQLTTGATFVEEYEDCTYRQTWPGTRPEGYVYGPGEVTCVAPLEIPVDQGFLLHDPETGDALFHATFGKNLRGPAKLDGSVEVGLLDDLDSEEGLRTARKGKGKSFADAVAALKPATKSKALREADTNDNVAWYDFWSKPNKHDFAVTTTPVSGAIGETVEVPYTVVNNGPSDGSGGWTFVAPSGTVLVRGEDGDGPWCYFQDGGGHPVDELPTVNCSTESEWPATASGYGGVKTTIKLRIISTPGDDGTLTVRPGSGPTEVNPDNNVAKLVINVGSGGGGGGLPVTGAKAGVVVGIGAGVLALGAVLFLVARRRRIVTVAE
ncbi:hypothetical protein I0C86_30190 [Plantactinospora sp. S1510]|uniref:LPXTG-motif cell wall anchor domain-containing protein n=1 Tax=Plantactinospora alkalitolerans TaxID=2789879 RepID=A0ABS0H4G5_9ACTN|nr:hypothetical protein [Plantactinospora alkalitolerans]MBF9133201.1 hypothetical protein [Plantactinospora alkalitolerans]